jgi:hypothetical protein
VSRSFRGLSRLRSDLSVGIGTGFATCFSRASIPVEWRELWPIIRFFWVASITAACRGCGNSDAAELAKARENCDSLGIWGPALPAADAPQGTVVVQTNCRVWLRLSTALATKARLIAGRAGSAALRQHSKRANRRLDLSQFKNRDQLLPFVGQRPLRLSRHRKQP